jgi:hypothetical protein
MKSVLSAFRQVYWLLNRMLKDSEDAIQATMTLQNFRVQNNNITVIFKE